MRTVTTQTKLAVSATGMTRAVSPLGGTPGLFVLKGNGQIGTYDFERLFHIDELLSQRLSACTSAFLKTYVGNPDEPDWRLGVVYNSNVKNPWGFETFVLEESILRKLYPVGGKVAGELTSFQKRNRVKSIYQGFELLLEHKHDDTPDAALYCPVLFNRHTTLDQYAAMLNGQAEQENLNTAVVEIVNLAAVIPVARRADSEFRELQSLMHQRLIDKGMRRSSRLTLADGAKRFGVNLPDASAKETFGNTDKRTDRRVTLLTGNPGSALQIQFADRLWQAESCESVARYAQTPFRYLDPRELSAFDRFRNLDEAALALLAATSPVYRAPGGSELLKSGTTDSWNLYLLEGTLELAATDGAIKAVEAGTPAARSPVSFLKPRKYTASTVSPVRFLWIHDAAVDAIARGHLPSRYVF
jgi:hypothetical protein